MNAMYIGSFDPFTLGHLNIVNKALEKYEELIICVGKNDTKNSLFTADKRKKLIELVVATHPRYKDINVIISNDLTVDIARCHNVNVLVRGIRSDADMQNEAALAETNRSLAAMRGYELKTDFFTQEDEFLKAISSSLVRKLLEIKEYTAAARYLPKAIAQEILASYLKEIFCEKFSNLSVAEHLWNRIVETYSPRPYHNLLHLAYMFDMLKLYQKYNETSAYSRWELHLAIFLHDYVYDTGKTPSEPYSNETDSANLVNEWKLERYIQLPYYKNLQLIASLIMATTHNDAFMRDSLHMLIADLDLSILGTADTVTWKNYTDGIRKEYAAFSDEEYKQERLHFLFKLLKKKHIFRTAFFCKMLEEQTRKNITAEIKRLHGKS